MADLVLATLNARYTHCAAGVRYLYANLGELRERAVVREFVATQRAVDIAEQLLADEPRVIGLGVYVWNAARSLEVVKILRAVRPDVIVVVGGPEVSHDVASQPICAAADYVVCGEADLAFAALARTLLAGERPNSRVVVADLPDLSALTLPYDVAYSEHDLGRRFVYVEASRGCPYRCEFCLSALDRGVRTFDRDRLFAALDGMMARGGRHFRFVDRTFNLDVRRSAALLEFFLDRMETVGRLFVHFEVVPEHFPEPLRVLVERFPTGTLQLEVGVQTLDPDVARRIHRVLKPKKLEDNLRFLAGTSAHVHADLIAGLPGEDVAMFARGFDRLVAMGPDEIQVGVLKRLRGAPIARHDTFMTYADEPPYEVLQTDALRFEELQRLKRFARLWDLVANRGQFPRTLPILLGDAPFASFEAFTVWVSGRVEQLHGIELLRLFRLVFEWLVARGHDVDAVRATLAADYDTGARRLPRFLQEGGTPTTEGRKARRDRRQARQERHSGQR